MGKLSIREKGRLHRKRRIKKKITGLVPRLSVFRSAKHLYAQVIDDKLGKTVAAASTREKDLKGDSLRANVESAKKIGALVAKRATVAGIKEVVFDRNGFAFHGKVKALADSARESGLKF